MTLSSRSPRRPRHLVGGTLATLSSLLLGAALSSGGARAADVVVEILGTQERGQGTLLRRGNECIVVTPRHVVVTEEGKPRGLGRYQVIYADRTKVQASRLQVFKEDVALLRLAEQPRAACAERPFETDRIEARLHASAEALLKRREPDGSDAFMPVRIVSFDASETIRVTPSAGSIEQGHSGSVLHADGRAVGMLTRVDQDSGLGLVMRGDKLMATIGSFLAASRRDETLYLSLDADSAFLEEALSRDARRRGLALTADEDAAAMRLLVTGERKDLDTDTGKIVRLSLYVEALDALDNLVAEERIEASGNSFVSLDAAADNAREDLARRLSESGLLERLR